MCAIIDMLFICVSITSLFRGSLGRNHMRISYQKLWRMMRDNKMKKGDLASAAEISDYAMAKLNKEEPVSLEIIMRLCKVFHCDIGDLVEIIEDL